MIYLVINVESSIIATGEPKRKKLFTAHKIEYKHL